MGGVGGDRSERKRQEMEGKARRRNESREGEAPGFLRRNFPSLGLCLQTREGREREAEKSEGSVVCVQCPWG